MSTTWQSYNPVNPDGSQSFKAASVCGWVYSLIVRSIYTSVSADTDESVSANKTGLDICSNVYNFKKGELWRSLTLLHN